MDSSLLRKEFVAGLVDVVSMGINHNKLEDAETVLIAVRGLRPRLAELDTFDAWIAMKRSFWGDAIRHLRNVDASASNWWIGKALMAFCQFATDDPSWQASANDVVHNSDSAEAIALVRLLLSPGPLEDSLLEPDEPESSRLEPQPMISQGMYLRG